MTEYLVKLMAFIQDPLCSSEQMDCVHNITVDTTDCLKPCSGLIVTSFTKTRENRNFDNWLTVLDDYRFYKKVTTFPAEKLPLGRYNQLISCKLTTNVCFQIMNGRTS